MIKVPFYFRHEVPQLFSWELSLAEIHDNSNSGSWFLTTYYILGWGHYIDSHFIFTRPWNRHHYPHLIGKNTDTQRGQVTPPNSRAWSEWLATQQPASHGKKHLEQTGSNAPSPGQEPIAQNSTAGSSDTDQPTEQRSLPAQRKERTCFTRPRDGSKGDLWPHPQGSVLGSHPVEPGGLWENSSPTRRSLASWLGLRARTGPGEWEPLSLGCQRRSEQKKNWLRQRFIHML